MLSEHVAVRGRQHELPLRLSELAGLSYVAASESAFCGVRRVELLCWGDAYALSPQRERGGTFTLPMPPACKVLLGMSHGCALLKSGKVTCFGATYSAALGHPVSKGYEPVAPTIVEGIPTAIDIAVGSSMSCALGEAMVVHCWGHFPGGDWNRPQIAPLRIRITVPAGAGSTDGEQPALHAMVNGTRIERGSLMTTACARER
jgi:hypothetical protein